ncbi:MAG: hypothetical protein A2W21_01455 [Betaproteobacteria bacterium RBG_16_66_20]|nr:MAG: hypothetical protein A2W21_01455 [Betaproteobacteria bacterium RBG_16_66_20]
MAGTSFLPIYDAEYAEKLGLRGETFRQAFAILEAMEKSSYTIVETGCARAEGNWYGDGQSTLLFDRFVNHWGGSVRTVDISQDACTWLRGRVSSKVTVTCSDSVAYLRELTRSDESGIDLLYLDSFDLDWRNPHPAALHHLHELCAIMPLLASGTLIVVDDTARNQALVQFKGREMIVHDYGVAGKGGYVAEFFAKIGCAPVIQGYQHGWIMP